ncbi:hypothetical protein ACIQ2D_15380 [Lysinibacillus sp. NPDC097287]|uniref:hypothetical protein n=1 Tax=Lysinibacillus sp. NPDC097287 TaxID=3364144 RepID=UPI00381BEC14
MELAEVIGGTFLSIFVSIICFGSAYLIGYKKDLSIIAGYDESSSKGDKDKLAKKVG